MPVFFLIRDMIGYLMLSHVTMSNYIIPVSAKITTIAIKSRIERYAFHIVFCRSERMSLYIGLHGNGRYFRRHRYQELLEDFA